MKHLYRFLFKFPLFDDSYTRIIPFPAYQFSIFKIIFLAQMHEISIAQSFLDFTDRLLGINGRLNAVGNHFNDSLIHLFLFQKTGRNGYALLLVPAVCFDIPGIVKPGCG